MGGSFFMSLNILKLAKASVKTADQIAQRMLLIMHRLNCTEKALKDRIKLDVVVSHRVTYSLHAALHDAPKALELAGIVENALKLPANQVKGVLSHCSPPGPLQLFASARLAATPAA